MVTGSKLNALTNQITEADHQFKKELQELLDSLSFEDLIIDLNDLQIECWRGSSNSGYSYWLNNKMSSIPIYISVTEDRIGVVIQKEFISRNYSDKDYPTISELYRKLRKEVRGK